MAARFLLLSLAMAVASAEVKPPFPITTRRDDDRVEAKVDGGRAILTIESPSGISDAVIGRPDGGWPETVILRLRLGGLEQFSATGGRAALRSDRSHSQPLRFSVGGVVRPAPDARSPDWAEIRAIGRHGAPTGEIPLKGGYFEVKLPRAFFEDDPGSIRAEWVDFYR
jgi:hypothetical protein